MKFTVCHRGWHKSPDQQLGSARPPFRIRSKPRLHDTTCCQTGQTTGGIVYTNIQPVGSVPLFTQCSRLYVFFVWLYIAWMCSYCNMVRWTWWDWSLSLGPLLPLVLWHCWLGHLTRKSPSRYDSEAYVKPWDVKPYSINQSIQPV